MKVRDLPDWESFETEVHRLQAEFQNSPSQLLYRGHNDSEFPLTTTLERAGSEGISFNDYYTLAVSKVAPVIEAFTGENWGAVQYDLAVKDLFYDRELLELPIFPVELYRYLVYLRDHGFPSPLLDWSHSPYVAAFFAFRDEPITKPEKRSIFACREMPRGAKGAVGQPTIRQLDPYVRSHPGHFRQQLDYTICARFDISAGWRFCPHELVLGRNDVQDIFWKFALPSTERIKVLRRLNDYALSAFSLFNSVETLLETVWLREHVLKGQAPQAPKQM